MTPTKSDNEIHVKSRRTAVYDLGGATTDLGVPEFNGPVKGRAEEILREVDGAGHRVRVNARHWTHVTFEHFANARFAVAKYTTHRGIVLYLDIRGRQHTTHNLYF